MVLDIVKWCPYASSSTQYLRAAWTSASAAPAAGLATRLDWLKYLFVRDARHKRLPVQLRMVGLRRDIARESGVILFF